MNQTQMKRFRERIEEKAEKAHKRLRTDPQERQLEMIRRCQKNPQNRRIGKMRKRIVAFRKDGHHHSEQAWLTTVEDQAFDRIGQVHEFAHQRIQRAQDEAIDAVVFLDEANAVKALEKFEKDLAKIK